ncbi:myb/SANT-like DNA-binding domain-containing protein 3 [Centruroides vittatus]|uniref:myb/SANT-like DNA-binding domain-containing protein 3 n=1 Tax=Centruroides vittatus TaxID=120091 RepID=UPI00350FE5DB
MAESQTDNGARRNFTNFEKEILLELVEKYKSIIENKKTNAVSSKQKRSTWEVLTEEFNGIPGVTSRKSKQLWDCYKNLKKKAVKEQSQKKAELFKTGGGFPPVLNNSDVMAEKLLSMGVLTQPLHNDFDSDAQPNTTEIATTSVGNVHDISDVSASEVSVTPQLTEITNVMAMEVIEPAADFYTQNIDNQQSSTKKKRKQPEAAEAIYEHAKRKKETLEEEHSLKIKFLTEEHNMKMQLMKAQLKVQEKILQILENNPSSLCLQLTNL